MTARVIGLVINTRAERAASYSTTILPRNIYALPCRLILSSLGSEKVGFWIVGKLIILFQKGQSTHSKLFLI